MLGLGLGFLWGCVGGILPGVNHIFIYFWIVNLEPQFALLFILSSYITGSIISKSNYLTPVSAASNPLILDPISKLVKEGKGVIAIRCSAFNEMLGLFLVLIMMIMAIFIGETDFLDIPLSFQSGVLGVVMLIWLYYIFKAEKKILAAITILIAAIMAWIVLKMGHYAVYSMSTALFSVGLGSISLRKNTELPPQLDEYSSEVLDWEGVLVGIISSIGIGIPYQVLLSILEEDKLMRIIAKDGISSGVVAGFSLVLVSFNFSDRGTLGTMIGGLNLPNSNYYNFALFILTMLLGFISFEILPVFIRIYSWLSRKNFMVISSLVLIINIASVLILNSQNLTIGLLLMAGGVLYQWLVIESGMNRGASMAALSFLPIIGLTT